MKNLKIIFLHLLIIAVYGCSEGKFITSVIMFDTSNREITNKSEIIIYYSRLEVPSKFKEIGTVKYKGKIDEEMLKEIASQKGAHALIKDQENFILIEFLNYHKEKKDDLKTI